jgi:hypothetical protein
MPCMLVAYDGAGNVVATLDFMVARDAEGKVRGWIDFAAHEAAGGKLRDIWNVGNAVGSGTWPEWLGGQAHAFSVELDADNRITGLKHQASGLRRDRLGVEAAIAGRIATAGEDAADLRDLVGGPTAPLLLDEVGATIGRSPRAEAVGTPSHLPVLGIAGDA